MRKGSLVEVGPAADVLVNPRHEYTQRLLAAMPETPGAVPLRGLRTSGARKHGAVRRMPDRAFRIDPSLNENRIPS